MKKDKLITSRYDITLKNLDSSASDSSCLRMALVTDLHDRDPRKLLRLLKKPANKSQVLLSRYY